MILHDLNVRCGGRSENLGVHFKGHLNEQVLLLYLAKSKGGFKSEGRGGFSQLPKMSAEKLSWDLENENSDSF